MHRVHHAKEVRVHLTKRYQVLGGQLLRQTIENVIARYDFSTLPLARTELEALRCFHRGRVWCLVEVPFQQE